MSNRGIEGFTWITVGRLRMLNTFASWADESRIMLVSDHERIVKELEAQIDTFKTVEFPRRAENVAKMNYARALSDAIKEVERMPRQDYRSDLAGWIDVTEGGYFDAEDLLERLKSLGPQKED